MKFLTFACALSLTASLTLPVRADTPDHSAAKFASGYGNIIYLGAAVGLPFAQDGENGGRHAARAIDAIGTTVILTEGIKALVREKRPDSNEHNSFPSGHASAAFAAATMESAWHPKQAPYWYLGAALISYSRVRLNRHYVQDVLAGAALGYGVARLELSRPRGLLLFPLVQPDRRGGKDGSVVGLQMSGQF